MYAVLVVVLLILVIALVIVVARRIITFVVMAVAVLVVLLIVGRPLFAAYPGAVPLPAVRATAVVLFATALTALLTRGMVFLIGR